MADRLNGYYAAVLDPESSELLKDKAVHTNIFCHHVTLAYNPTEEVASRYKHLVGTKLQLRVTGIRTSNKCQAAIVEGVQTENKHSHVTISCADGTKPVESNELLSIEEGFFEEVDLQISAEVTFIKH